MPTPQSFLVLTCHRELVNTTRWENGRAAKFPEVAVSFVPLRDSAGEPWTILADTPEEALDLAHTCTLHRSPLNLLLAVEPVQYN